MTLPTSEPERDAAASGDPARLEGVGAGAAPGARHSIGELAAAAGVTTRTLRYYQELGLLDPGHSPGGSRRYTDADAARLRRIMELRSVMGFDLERIGEILESEDRLAQLKAEARRGISEERRREILAEAIAINARMREQVRAKRAVLDGFLAELESKAAHYATLAVELGLDQPLPATAAAR
ncbi:MAG: MerR family transcriptional regulator, repressor of the yfmOP operon [Acidimicrobiaceae bacterium]|nr:MerR family transcriptional regulator, repressor of the yfmOP operon [Acidimicrobiaceae bacterium]MDQ1439961.1 MerR family transcriptional regulator, repressor of the yfmOP operon [Acidimicrobiaceae bacterium]